MAYDLSVPGNGCVHRSTCVAFERTGAYFHQKVWLVMRCIDCCAELDRIKANRREPGYVRDSSKDAGIDS